MSRGAGSVGNSICDVLVLIIGTALQAVCVVDVVFGGLSNKRHGAYSLNRVLACGSLAREHYCGGAVINSVCNVSYLRTGGAHMGYHGFQHLCGSDDLLACVVALSDKALLDRGDKLKGNLKLPQLWKS